MLAHVVSEACGEPGERGECCLQAFCLPMDGRLRHADAIYFSTHGKKLRLETIGESARRRDL